MGNLTPIAFVAALIITACGSDDGGRDVPDVAEATTIDATSEVDAPGDDDVEVAETAVEIVDDMVGEVAEVEVAETSVGDVFVDRNCEFDPRLTNGRSHELRCTACRSAVGFVRVRAELLWTGTYDAPMGAPTACDAFAGEQCKASVVEVEALLCGNLSTGALRVVWSDVVEALVGTGEEQRVVDVRGPEHRIRLADVWADPAAALLSPEAALAPGSWLVGDPGDQVPVMVEEHFRQTACPIGRFEIDGTKGAIGACELAVGLIGKEQ